MNSNPNLLKRIYAAECGHSCVAFIPWCVGVSPPVAASQLLLPVFGVPHALFFWFMAFFI